MIKIFADGADLDQIAALSNNALIAGFTTNPSLIRAAGVTAYLAFAKEVIKWIPCKPVSFEVIADEFDEMERQARLLSALNVTVYVKIPVTNTRGESSDKLIERLSKSGVKVNVTAVFHVKQVVDVALVLRGAPAIISIFAGRIADTGRDPAPLCVAAKRLCTMNVEVLWASTRELLNIKQAEDCGCNIITLPNDLLAKLPLIGKDLTQYSLETVRQFHDDAKASGFTL